MLTALSMVFCHGADAVAQELCMSYITEWQTDFRKKSAWVNLLQTEASYAISPVITAHIGMISTCRTGNGQLISNLLTFSNIEEECIPLALSRMGISWERDNFRVFAGIGNANDEFFATPISSLFTNSSCGMYPTVSANFGIANYPDASVGIEGRYENGGIRVNSALYNGRASHRFCGRENVFRFCPSSDGIFNINGINYIRNGSNYNVGWGVYRGSVVGKEDGIQEFQADKKAEKKETEVFYWAYAEQRIVGNLSLVVQYSQCPGIREGCRDFGGLGLAYGTDRCSVGVYSCYADFTDDFEWASELTLKYRVSPGICLQPSMHYIHNSSSRGVAGLFRIYLTL